MGVRGLTTYIAKNAEKYLKPFELHDTCLVIDGDNLASQLFNRSQHSCFGGNYDEYFQVVLNFFTLLRKCNVTPYVLLDGGYEEKKMRTIKTRLQTRICAVKHVLPMTRKIIIPLFMREVFVDAVKSAGVQVMRCFFEADDEIAILARKLNCPVLSYDSDFYIHNVAYIPFVSITMKVYKKVIEDEENYEIQIIGKGKKNKKQKPKKVVVGNPEPKSEALKEAYCYIDCCVYTIDNLLEHRALEKEMMPLFATLLGNDFIERRMFRKFYSNVKMKKKSRKQGTSPQQRRIASIFEWLKNENLKSALHKISAVMKGHQRDGLIRQIKAAMLGYNSERSAAFEYFGFEEQEIDDGEVDLDHIEMPEIEDEEEKEETDSAIDEDNEEEDDDDLVEIEDEEVEDEEVEDEEVEDEEVEEEEIPMKKPLPEWLQQRYSQAELPRFFVDLFAGRRYVNYPQVEDLSLDDSNEICYPILLRIFSILHYPEKPTLWYMTRVQRYARFYYKKFETYPEISDFNPDKAKNLEEFKKIFTKFNTEVEIFESLDQIPPQLRLYLLAIIFWMSRSKLVTSIHLHTVLLCILVTFIVDKKFSITHDAVKFTKAYSKLIEDIKQSKIEASTENSFTGISKMINKHEGILAMERLITNFSATDKFERRHADFKRDIVHSFAELQSVCFFFHSYNALCGHPFEDIKMGQVFNGFFIYNTYVSLKSRSDIAGFLGNHVFRYSPNFLKLHAILFEWCKKLLPNLHVKDVERIRVKAKKTPSVKVVAVKEAKQKLTTDKVDNDCVVEESDEEFEDVNNLFSQLLTIS